MTFLRLLLLSLSAANSLSWAGEISADSFLEPETPFLRSALVFEHEGERHIIRRGLLLPLDEKGTWACFDPDLLSWAVVWKAPEGTAPLSYDSMAAVSYPNGKAKASQPPQLAGEIIAANSEEPGPGIGSGNLQDSRAELLEPVKPVGPLALEDARFYGISLRDKQPVIHYRIGETNIAETFQRESDGTWQRLLEISPTSTALSFEKILPDFKVKGLHARVTSERLLVAPFGGRRTIQLSTADTIAEVPFPEPEPAASLFDKEYVAKNPASQESAPFTIQPIAFPRSKRAVRAVDLAFHSDGRAFVTTLDGDVWQVTDIEAEESTWQRIATGIFEPMGIEINSRDQIFVLGRDQITELIDNNDDGIIDIYRNASDIFQQTLHTRDYATSLALAKDGSFLIAKGGIVSFPSKGSNELSAHRGTVVKISPDGKTAEVIADGLRMPFVGRDRNDVVFASDQQGNYVPSTPLHRIDNSKPFLGFEPTNFRKESTATEPLLWYPYQHNRSGAGFATLQEKGFPDIANTFVQVSWNGRLFAIETPQDERSFSWQLPLQLDFPALNGASHPETGAFFAAGLGISGYSPTTKKTVGIAAISQATPFPTPESLVLTDTKVIVTFHRALKEDETVLPDSEALRLYNIKRTGNYGSGHFQWNGEPGEHRLPATTFALSEDRTTLTMGFEMLRRSDVFDLTLQVTTGTETFPLHLYTLPKELPEARSDDIRQLAREKEESRITPGDVTVGKTLFTQYACIGCHSMTGEKLVGPPLNDLSQKADEAFTRESILEPTAKITEGYEAAMPSFEGVIPEQELAHLIAYLKTL
jgi:cytochrome c2